MSINSLIQHMLQTKGANPPNLPQVSKETPQTIWLCKMHWYRFVSQSPSSPEATRYQVSQGCSTLSTIEIGERMYFELPFSFSEILTRIPPHSLQPFNGRQSSVCKRFFHSSFQRKKINFTMDSTSVHLQTGTN